MGFVINENDDNLQPNLDIFGHYKVLNDYGYYSTTLIIKILKKWIKGKVTQNYIYYIVLNFNGRIMNNKYVSFLINM